MKSTPKQRYDKNCRTETELHNQYLAKFKEALVEERKKCKHKETKFHPDASGNNDSYYECINCGKKV